MLENPTEAEPAEPEKRKRRGMENGTGKEKGLRTKILPGYFQPLWERGEERRADNGGKRVSAREG